jgi:hypothetical protein
MTVSDPIKVDAGVPTGVRPRQGQRVYLKMTDYFTQPQRWDMGQYTTHAGPTRLDSGTGPQ